MAAGAVLLALAAPAIHPVLLGLASPSTPEILFSGEAHTCLLYADAGLKWCAPSRARAPRARGAAAVCPPPAAPARRARAQLRAKLGRPARAG